MKSLTNFPMGSRVRSSELRGNNAKDCVTYCSHHIKDNFEIYQSIKKDKLCLTSYTFKL